MLREERLVQITERLMRERQVSSRELAASFGMTAASVRLDLAELERRGIAHRVYGGAILAKSEAPYARLTLREATINERLDLQRAEKEAIGRLAATLIHDGETIMIDGGTTTHEVVRHLAARHNLTLVTCALNPLWQELAARSDLEIFLTGGFLRAKSGSLVGEVAENMLRGFRASKAILGIDGISLEHGLTTLNFLEAAIKRRMIEASQELLIVADHTKFGKIGLIPVGDLTQATTIVTDSGVRPELLEQLRARNVHVLMAKPAVQVPA
jgi:DeoR/GlpR family transcriptional regulator of sugar metabolism